MGFVSSGSSSPIAPVAAAVGRHVQELAHGLLDALARLGAHGWGAVAATRGGGDADPSVLATSRRPGMLCVCNTFHACRQRLSRIGSGNMR